MTDFLLDQLFNGRHIIVCMLKWTTHMGLTYFITWLIIDRWFQFWNLKIFLLYKTTFKLNVFLCHPNPDEKDSLILSNRNMVNHGTPTFLHVSQIFLQSFGKSSL